MKPIASFQTEINFLFTDIDDTLTTHGQLPAEAYTALWDLSKKGIQVVPVTGRPAGWCEMIARLWPVAGVVGENGGFYFRYHEQKMIRFFQQPEAERIENRKKLDQLQTQILNSVPGCAIASDQFCRLMDLAIDFCEDVHALPKQSIDQIVALFESVGAQAKVSSIHVNGWFGKHNKLSTTLEFLKNEFQMEAADSLKACAFSGDSPNDEPMFEYFPHSFGVANIINFANQLKHPPKYVTLKEGGQGFVEIAEALIKAKK